MKRAKAMTPSPTPRSCSLERATISSSIDFASSIMSVGTTPVADASTRPANLSPVMMNSVIELANHTSERLVEQAQKYLETPMPHKRVKLLFTSDGINYFQRLGPIQPPSEQPSTVESHHAKVSWTQSLRNLFRLRRKRAAPTTSSKRVNQAPIRHLPRIFGVTRVHVPLDDLLDVVGHQSSFAPSVLHPGMKPTGFHHTLVDCIDEHVCLRSLSLRSQHSPISETRDFLVVEHYHAFETPTGRRGYVISFHSVNWTDAPPPKEEVV